MRRIILILVLFLIPIAYGAAECKPASNIAILCKNSDCVYTMDEDIALTLNIYIDNIGLEGTQVKFYLYEAGKKDDCLSDSSNCLKSGSNYAKYIVNNKAEVTFEKLGEYKSVEVTARLMKDGSTVTKSLSVRPSIRVTLSYPSSNMQGIYSVNELAETNVEITNLVSQSPIISPSSFVCKVSKGTAEISSKQCTPSKISFTPNSVGTYRVWAKAEYSGLDPSTGDTVLYYPSEDFIDISVQLPQQKIETIVGGTDINSLPKVGDSYEIDSKPYTFQIKSSMSNEPYSFDECSIKITAPDISTTTYALDDSGDKKIVTQKCTSSYNECVYTFSYDFKTAGDQYTMEGSCEKGDFIQTFDTKFVTRQRVAECTKGFIQCNLGLIIGVSIGVVFLIIFIIILAKIRGKRPQVPQGELP